MIKPKEKNNDSKLFQNSNGLELVIVKNESNYIYLVFDNKELIDIEIENPRELPLHTKCVAKVNSISENINAAYVILPDKNKAFLKLSGNKLKCEQNIAVEITRASSKGKLQSVKLIDEDISHRTDFSIIEYGDKAYKKLFGNYNFDKIVTDIPDLYQELTEYSKTADVIDLSKIHMYNDAMVSLSVLFSVSKRIKEATSKLIWLKSGANITIEETNAFTVIDVNSAKKEKSGVESYLDINIEATKEIFKQMNLRNLSGIILIDFINLNKDDEKELIEYIKQLCSNQKSYTKLVDITSLGIAELTRKKEGRTLSDIIK